MNVNTHGELIPLVALPQLLSEKLGRKPAIRTIKRWRKEGACGGKVFLETTRRGHHLYTTREWLDQFFKQQEEHRKDQEAITFMHRLNFRRTMQRKHSRRANRAHQEAVSRLQEIYG